MLTNTSSWQNSLKMEQVVLIVLYHSATDWLLHIGL